MEQCLVCEQPITNPVCPQCLAEEMKEWLRDYRPEETGLFDVVSVPGSDVQCIRCGQPFSVCAHCYARDVSLGLFNRHPDLIQPFLDTFNFEMR